MISEDNQKIFCLKKIDMHTPGTQSLQKVDFFETSKSSPPLSIFFEYIFSETLKHHDNLDLCSLTL